MISDTHYTDPRIAQVYDLENSWADDTDYYLSLAHTSGMKILDLGCGTGILTHAFAQRGHRVTGLDPAQAMIDIAKMRDTENKVHWIVDLAQNYEPKSMFDLIVMTGHTFQAILEDEDLLKVFTIIKSCLHPDGVFAFESRNPAIDWKERFSHRQETVKTLPSGEVRISTDSVNTYEDKISFRHHYKFSDTMLTSESVLRFMTKEVIEAMLEKVGLQIIEMHGDWKGGGFTDTSLEMIFKVQHSKS